MKRFIAFVWAGHDAGGGWNDVLYQDFGDLLASQDKILSFETPEGAEEKVKQTMAEHRACDQYQIVDLRTGKIVASTV